MKTVHRTTLGAIVSALALSLATAASAGAWHGQPVDRTVYGGLVDVQVVVDGASVPLYLAPGHADRRYLQALRGRSYALRVHNRTGARVGVLVAVDGLNVVNGERSGLRRDEAMYVLDPYETATIRGWRTSLDQVRRFVFVDEQRSYAERTGQANGDMGWIRVLAFEEKRPVSWLRPGTPQRTEGRERAGDELRGNALPAPKDREAAPAPSRVDAEGRRGAAKSMAGAPEMAPRAESYPGTGWGERREDHVEETWFVAAGGARDHLVLRYEYADGLRALGIRLGGDRLIDRERGTLGFAQPPRW